MRLNKSIKKEEKKDERDERGIERPTEGWMGMQFRMGGVRDWLRTCLHGGRGPQVGEVTRLGGVTHMSI